MRHHRLYDYQAHNHSQFQHITNNFTISQLTTLAFTINPYHSQYEHIITSELSIHNCEHKHNDPSILCKMKDNVMQ